ncbi:MAG: hypothetical protein ACP5NW_01480 [Candidatus Woesearchaeota archaeon]
MKQVIIFLGLALMLTGLVAAPAPTCNTNSGSIWTTSATCGAEQQDVNHYSVGEKVYINGNNFCKGSYDWTITGQPGQASCDPKIIVAQGTQVVGSDGTFCIEAYTVINDDCGEYTVDFGKKNDNYRVTRNPTNGGGDNHGVPEFSPVSLGVATALTALGVLYLRKY